MLNKLLTDLRSYSGITAKRQIASVASALSNAHSGDYANGDDAAVVRTSDSYDLFAAEGFLPQFVKKDPWFAGWCGVMVNVSDIAAMGGRPTGIVNTVWGRDDEISAKLFRGMAEASKRYRVPILGGHTNLDSPEPYLSVSIVGRAKNLLTSFAAQPGHSLVAAVDLRAEFRSPFLNWNAATESSSERLIGDLELLPVIAERGLACAAKDVSQAGFLGTTLMLIESSNVGAEVQLELLPKPQKVAWHDWLRAFPSFGYLLTTPTHKADELVYQFEQRGITAAQFGRITSGSCLDVYYQDEKETFWDLSQEPLTGLSSSLSSGSRPSQPLPSADDVMPNEALYA